VGGVQLGSTNLRCGKQIQITRIIMKLNKLVRFAALVVAVILIAGTPAIRSVCPSACAADQKAEILNNASIIELQQLDLGDGVILAKIKTSKCNFDVNPSDLKLLKEAKVSGAVIEAMIIATTPATPPPPLPVTPGTPTSTVVVGEVKQLPVGDINDPNTYHDSGVWFYEEIGGAKKMTQLSTEAYDISHMFIPFGGGISGSAAVLPGVAAKTQSSSRRPIFYMYFGEGRQNNMDMMATLTPDQLPLTHLKVTDNKKKQERTVSIGSGGAFGGHDGIPMKERRSVDWSKVGPGIYKVTPQQDLDDGEYAFFYSHSQVQEGAAGRVYCFGVHLK
jgi:hypothetical protein